MKNRLFILCLTLVMLFLLSACGSYYMIKDPTTDKVYYTEKIKTKDKGAIQFKDTLTDSEVTLQNSEIMEIEKEEFKKGIAPEPMTEKKAE